MVLVKILKRGDAASIIVAIVLAMSISNAFSIMFMDIAGWVAGIGEDVNMYQGFSEGGWRTTYLFPVVTLVLQLIALELVARVAIYAREQAIKLRNK